MLESIHSINEKPRIKNGKNGTNGQGKGKYKRLASMAKVSFDLINELYKPTDAINRFINLTLQETAEDSQNRQFLLESKSGVRRISFLLKKLNVHAKKLEKEIVQILEVETNEPNPGATD